MPSNGYAPIPRAHRCDGRELDREESAEPIGLLTMLLQRLGYYRARAAVKLALRTAHKKSSQKRADDRARASRSRKRKNDDSDDGRPGPVIRRRCLHDLHERFKSVHWTHLRRKIRFGMASCLRQYAESEMCSSGCSCARGSLSGLGLLGRGKSIAMCIAYTG